MDLYQKNPLTLKKLLAKRQNPCTQVFKSQPSTITSEPLVPTNLQQKATSSLLNNPSPQIMTSPLATIILTSNISSSSNESQTIHMGQEEQQTSEDDGDARPPRHENPTKKIKKSPVNPEEEERDERESTSCETLSESGNAYHEIPEFFLSPAMSLGPRKESTKMEEFKLDDGFAMSSSEEEILLKEAQEIAKKNDGLFFTTGSCILNAKLKFKCKFNHQFTNTVDDYKIKWCPRCEELLKDYKDFAAKCGGRCINQKFEEYISFECCKGHTWKLNYKNAKKRWCLDCQKDERAELRKKCEAERLLRQKKEEEDQKKLFEEAKRRAMEEQSRQNFAKQPCMYPGFNTQHAQSIVEYFQRMDYEIEKLAQKYSREYMSRKEFAGEASYQQILQVYKILIMPDDVLQNYMNNLSSDMLKQEFRRFAKIIHPDKNKHPQAGVAFQKIYKVYEAALVRIDAAQKI